MSQLNAVKFTPAGGRVSLDAIYVFATDTAHLDWIQIVVSDACIAVADDNKS